MALQDIFSYIEQNKNKFSLDKLVAQLRASGYPESEIQEVLRKINMGPPSRTVADAGGFQVSIGQASTGRIIAAWVSGFLLAVGIGIGAGIVFVILALAIAFGGAQAYLVYSIGAVAAIIIVGGLALIIRKSRLRFPHFVRGIIAGIIGLVVVVLGFLMWSQWLVHLFVGGNGIYLNGTGAKSRDARRVADIKQMQLALELYRDAKNDYPDEVSLLSPDYIPIVPTDPSSGAFYTYEKRNSEHYYLAAQLEDSSNSALAYDVNPGNILFEVEEGVNTGLSPGATSFSIKILSPNGGEILERGKGYQIRWEINDFAKIPKEKLSTTHINIRMTKKPGIEGGTLIADMPLASVPGSYWWTVPGNIAAGSYKITVNVHGVGNSAVPEPYWGLPDESDGFFTVISKR